MSEKEPASRRGRRPRPETARKDRIIQTRVPQDLEATLKDAADQNRVSVSQLIRNVLEDTFNLVDNIVADSASLVDTVRRDAQRIAASARRNTAGPTRPAAQQAAGTDEFSTPTSTALDEVDAWQDVIVNRPGQCAQCDTPLVRGQHAFRGLSSKAGAAPVWLCASCIEKL